MKVKEWTNIPFPVCDAIEDLNTMVNFYDTKGLKQNKVLLDIVHLISYNSEVMEGRLDDVASVLNEKCAMIYRSVLHEKQLMLAEADRLS